jgi:hypothetical protein
MMEDMKRNELIIAGVVVVVLAGLIVWQFNTHRNSEQAAEQAELGTASIADATVHTLVNAKGEVKIGNTLSASGDMDGDGAPDTAAVLSETGAGRAKFVSVVLFRNADGAPEYVNGVFIGDRDEVQSLAINDGILTVDYLSHRPNDLVSKPTKPETMKLKLTNGELVSI